jgi:hypothetical protein
MELWLRAALLVPLLVVGLVSFVFVRSQQGAGGALVARQQQSGALTPAAVARVVIAAPDPVTRAAGVWARCTPSGTGDLFNPWHCSIGYASGRQIQYLVTVSANGSYTGNDELVRYRGKQYRDTGVISGCCISIP